MEPKAETQQALAAATWLRRASACLRPDCTDCGLGRVRSRRKPDHRPPERFVAGSRDLVGRSQRGGDHRADRHRPADAPAAPARRAAEARPRLSRRGAFALPDGAGSGHDRRARGTTRRCARGRRGGDARRGRGAPARLRRGAERARQGDTRTFGARTRVLADDREGAPSGPRGRRSPQLGGTAARHRQARGLARDPQQAGAADGRGMGADPAPPRAGRTACRAAAGVARRVDERHLRPSRALGRHRLPEGHRGRGHLARGPHRGRRRRVRRHDLGALLQAAERPGGCSRRDRALRRRSVRSARRARVPEHLARPAAARHGPALVAGTGAGARAHPAHSRRGDGRELRPRRRRLRRRRPDGHASHPVDVRLDGAGGTGRESGPRDAWWQADRGRCARAPRWRCRRLRAGAAAGACGEGICARAATCRRPGSPAPPVPPSSDPAAPDPPPVTPPPGSPRPSFTAGADQVVTEDSGRTGSRAGRVRSTVPASRSRCPRTRPRSSAPGASRRSPRTERSRTRLPPTPAALCTSRSARSRATAGAARRPRSSSPSRLSTTTGLRRRSRSNRARGRRAAERGGLGAGDLAGPGRRVGTGTSRSARRRRTRRSSRPAGSPPLRRTAR